jgi:hypothetical protein
MSFPKFDNPELLNDFQNILNTLEKIKSVEEMSLSGGDFKRSTLNLRGDVKNSDKKLEKKSSGSELYFYILQILGIFIGWILRRSENILSTICDFIGKIISDSFFEISEDFQSLFDSTRDAQSICYQIIRNLSINKVFHLLVITLLPPIFATVKILLIFNKFLLSEVPFE